MSAFGPSCSCDCAPCALTDLSVTRLHGTYRSNLPSARIGSPAIRTLFTSCIASTRGSTTFSLLQNPVGPQCPASAGSIGGCCNKTPRHRVLRRFTQSAAPRADHDARNTRIRCRQGRHRQRLRTLRTHAQPALMWVGGRWHVGRPLREGLMADAHRDERWPQMWDIFDQSRDRFYGGGYC